MAFCSKCGNQIDSNAAFCPKCGAAQAPSAQATPEDLVACPSCNRPNWRTARDCYSCGRSLAGGPPPAQAIAPAASFPNIASRLPKETQATLLPGEPAYAYVSSAPGCGSSGPSQLLVTDSRVIVKGIDPTQAANGCNSAAQTQSLEIPIHHVSSVSERNIASGCSTQKGIGVSSGSATLVVRGKSPKELEGAVRILQALIRSRSHR